MVAVGSKVQRYLYLWVSWYITPFYGTTSCYRCMLLATKPSAQVSSASRGPAQRASAPLSGRTAAMQMPPGYTPSNKMGSASMSYSSPTMQSFASPQNNSIMTIPQTVPFPSSPSMRAQTMPFPTSPTMRPFPTSPTMRAQAMPYPSSPSMHTMSPTVMATQVSSPQLKPVQAVSSQASSMVAMHIQVFFFLTEICACALEDSWCNGKSC